jgi:hypothetical protein
MVERVKFGTSIKYLELLDLERRINPLMSTTLVNPTTCNTHQPTQDGGRSGSTTVLTLATLETERRSPSQEVLIKKLNQFGPSTSIEEDIQLSFGRSSTPTTWEMKLTKPRVLIKILDSK